MVDNTDIYAFTPRIETYRSEITTLAKRALEDPEHVGNPIRVFCPEFWKQSEEGRIDLKCDCHVVRRRWTGQTG
jgi:hypothetical protein